MNPDLVIRNAFPTDAQSISTLIRGKSRYCIINPSGEGAEHFFSTITPEAITGYVTSPNFIYLLGFISAEVAGVVGIRDRKHLYHLFVTSKFHRRGVGSALWAHAKTRALERGIVESFTVNSTLFALPVYKRFGFKSQGTLVKENGVAFVPMIFQNSFVDGQQELR